MDERAKPTTKAQELRAFLFLSVVLAPVLAVAVVSGYGFLVWGGSARHRPTRARSSETPPMPIDELHIASLVVPLVAASAAIRRRGRRRPAGRLRPRLVGSAASWS